MEQKTSRFFSKRYGKYWEELVSAGYISFSEKKGKNRFFNVIKEPLLSEEEFSIFLIDKYKEKLESLIPSIQDEIESLRDEIQDWYDNLPENFQSGDKGSELEECVQELESLEVPDVPEFLKDLEVVALPGIGYSRASRAERLYVYTEGASLVVAQLEPTAEAIWTNEQKSECKEFLSSLDDLSNGLLNISFPGMY